LFHSPNSNDDGLAHTEQQYRDAPRRGEARVERRPQSPPQQICFSILF
jgi:hypothetical protein